MPIETRVNHETEPALKASPGFAVWPKEGEGVFGGDN
jgi:hypothetical protein